MPTQQAQFGRLVLVNGEHGLHGVSGRFLELEDIGASPWSEICQIFRDRAADYGFIERYPKGKENITHIGHEPWHFRYVGVEHAKQMTERNLTLEEYVEWLKNTTGKEEGYGATYPYTPRRLRG